MQAPACGQSVAVRWISVRTTWEAALLDEDCVGADTSAIGSGNLRDAHRSSVGPLSWARVSAAWSSVLRTSSSLSRARIRFRE